MFASHVGYPVGLSCHNSYSTSLHKIRDGIYYYLSIIPTLLFI